MRRLTPIAVLAAVGSLGLVGCGGGSAQSTSDAGGGTTQTLVLGNAKLSMVGKATPNFTTGSGSVTVTSISGAAFTLFQTLPPATLANTAISFATYNHGFYIYSNGQLTNLGGSATGPVTATSFTKNGTIAYVSGSNGNVYTCNYDGSGPHQVTTTGHASEGFNWGYLNNQMTYSDGSSIYLNNTSGTAETTLLGSAVDDHNPSLSPSGTSLLCTNTTGVVTRILVVPVGNSSGAFALPIDTNYNCDTAVYSPDGKYIAYVAIPSSGQPFIRVIDATTFASEWVITAPTNHLYLFPTFSPDGKELAFSDIDTSTSSATLDTSTLAGDQLTVVASLGSDIPTRPSWSTYFPGRTWIGPSSPVFTTQSSGLIWGQNGTAFAGLLTFNATTPSTASIIQLSSSNTGSITYHCQADNIIGFRYVNSYFGSQQAIGEGITDMIVSVDGSTGLISTVAPLLVHGGTIAPKKVIAGQTEYTGDFKAVYNGKGVNLAPNGAKTLVLDSKTGAVVSVK